MNKKQMTVKTGVRAGKKGSINHNQSGLAVKTAVRAGKKRP